MTKLHSPGKVRFQRRDDAVHKESWRLLYADGLRAAGAAEFARGRQSLIDQGVRPPPWLPEKEW